jgi:hypothetical protein
MGERYDYNMLIADEVICLSADGIVIDRSGAILDMIS